MAELTESDIVLINTLKLQIEQERRSLQAALDNTIAVSQRTDAVPSEDGYDDPTEPDEEPNLKDAISSLLFALQGHRVAKKLRSKDSGGTVAGELAKLFNRLDSGLIEITLFDPLVKAVVRKASDIEIWKQVLALITSTSRLTPPPSASASASFGGTPRTLNSASHQGSEQTTRLVENALKPELQRCTFIDVDNVFEKYFDEKSWTEKSVDIYNSVKHTHTNGRWATFPSNPIESAVWSWWSSFQDEHLTDSRGVYYTTKSKDELRGLDSKSQLDIFIKSRKDSAVSAADRQVHDWADVLVIGEHTVSTKHSAKFWQLARYARNVFSAQPRRTFVLGFILANTTMELYTFDRSGVYRGKPFDIHKEPEHFIRVICGYSMMSDEELGWDTFIERDDEKLFVTVDDEDSGHDQRVELNPSPIVRRAAIVGRNTSCYLTADRQSVVKFSWVPASKKPTEPELLRMANKNNVQGVPRLVGHRSFTTISELRSPLIFSKMRRTQAQKELLDPRNDLSFSGQLESLPLSDNVGKRKSEDSDQGPSNKKSRSNSQASKLSQVYKAGDSFDNSQLSHASQGLQLGDEPYIDRVICCQVTQPAGDPLTEFKTIRTLLQALRDAIKVHRSLFLQGKILHRDVSASNIIITDPKAHKGLSGMLIDVELGTIVENGKNTRTGLKRMTGTLKYMAIEVLEMGLSNVGRDIEHTYRHDLESFFYVFLDMCINYGWEKGMAPKKDPLRAWYAPPDYEAIVSTKLGHMGLKGFERLILPKFSPTSGSLKDLATNLRDLLFLRGELRTGTPVGDESMLYNQMIGAFDKAIESLQG